MFLNPADVLRYFPVAPGQVVADFGAGDGAYTFLLSEKVSRSGTLYAFDRLPEAVECIRRECARRTSSNIYPLQADLNIHIPLRDELLHRAVVANTLHALHDHARFLDELNRVLKRGGAVLVVDWAASFNNMGPTIAHALSPGDASRLFRTHGFSVGAMVPAGSHHYAFVATRH